MSGMPGCVCIPEAALRTTAHLRSPGIEREIPCDPGGLGGDMPGGSCRICGDHEGHLIAISLIFNTPEKRMLMQSV